MSEDSPLVSVIMAAYNAEAYIEQAIQSIVGQSFKEWELLVIDDASQDHTTQIAEKFANADPRIHLISQKENRGVVHSRNTGIKAAKGAFIAILDSDDIAFPRRLELQLDFMESRPDHFLLGAACQLIDSEGNLLKQLKRSIPAEQLSSLLLFSNYFINSTVMIRKDALGDDWYQQGFQPSEDYELFSRLSKKGKLANLNIPLVYYRIHDQNISGDPEKLAAAITKIHRQLLLELEIEATNEELKMHGHLPEGPFPQNEKELQKVENWLLKIREQNRKLKVYPKQSLEHLIRLFYKRSCEHSGLGLKGIRSYFSADLSRGLLSDPLGNLIFILKTLYRSYGKG